MSDGAAWAPHAPIGRCATCCFAEALTLDLVDFPGMDERVKAGNALKLRYPLACMRAEMRDGQPEDQQTLAFTMDGSSYRASLLVAPEFGCVQYEAKP